MIEQLEQAIADVDVLIEKFGDTERLVRIRVALERAIQTFKIEEKIVRDLEGRTTDIPS